MCFRIGTQFGPVNISRAVFRKKLELELGLLGVFRDWLRNCFLVAYDSHTMRPDEVSATEFNQTLCDLHGPIYFGPFSQAKPLQRTSSDGNFILAEILGYRRFTVVDVESTLVTNWQYRVTVGSPSLCVPLFSPHHIRNQHGINCDQQA